MSCYMKKITKFKDIYAFQYDEGRFDYNDFYAKTGYRIVQENEAVSKKNVIRGMGYQTRHPQGKLLRVIHGAIFDVVVDIRKQSDDFSQWDFLYLSDTEPYWVWIPPGYAHGYLSLADDTKIIFKCTEYYQSNDEKGFLWNDQVLSINWPISPRKAVVSDKDSKFPSFLECMRNEYEYE